MTKFLWVWVLLIKIFQVCSVSWHMLTCASAAHGHVAFWMILQIHSLAKYCADSMYLTYFARTNTKVRGEGLLPAQQTLQSGRTEHTSLSNFVFCAAFASRWLFDLWIWISIPWRTLSQLQHLTGNDEDIWSKQFIFYNASLHVITVE